MKVLSINSCSANKHQSFNGIRIAQSENYQSTKKWIDKTFPEIKRGFYLDELQIIIKGIVNTNMDVSIPKGSNCPKFLEELKDCIHIENWDVDLYNETAEKLFGKRMHNVDVLIEPNKYNSNNIEYKQPVKYSVPAINMSREYFNDLGVIEFEYPAYPRSRDPFYMCQKSYMDLPAKGMIQAIKKAIFKHIINSDESLEYNTKIHRKFYETV